MNVCCGSRPSRPAGFSFGLLDGPPETKVLRTCRSPNSRARTDVALLFIAPCALGEAHGKGTSWRAWDGRVKKAWVSAASMNNPG